MKKSITPVLVLLAVILCFSVLPVFAADTISTPVANINDDVVTCNFQITSVNNGNTEVTLLAVVNSALVDGDLPDLSLLNETNVVYINQQKMELNKTGSMTFPFADAFKNKPFRVYIGAVDAEKVYVDVNESHSAGVTLTGTVRSYNPKNATTVRLLQGITVKYETIIEPVNGIDQRDQNFNINGVLPGEYSLVITKDAHLKTTVNKINIGDSNVDMKNDSRIAGGIITLICGDIINDGQIITMDLGKLIDNFGRAGNDIIEPLCDLNGDGQVISSDLGILLNNYGKSNVIIN